MLRTVAFASALIIACAAPPAEKAADPGPTARATGAAQPASVADDGSPQTRALAERLLGVVVTAVENSNVRLTEDARAQLRELTRTGASKLRDVPPDTRRRAEDDLRRLGQEIVKNAQVDPQTSVRTASIASVRNALKQWCPRYPFC
jgi:hypothetical protein